MIPSYDARTVQKGRQLGSIEAVKKRLIEIKDNPKSSYHKSYKSGNICVLKSKNKTYRGKGLQYDIVELIPMPIDDAICGECDQPFLNLNDDYLCESCRGRI